ncbi:hypothetical protein VIGAN_08257100, partial [Vigna angularis var. angularis]
MLQGRRWLSDNGDELAVVMVADDGLLRCKRLQKLEVLWFNWCFQINANDFCRRLAMKGVTKLQNFGSVFNILIHVFRNKEIPQNLIYSFLLFISFSSLILG